MLQALPGHDAVFIAGHINVNSEFLDIAGKYVTVVSYTFIEFQIFK